MVANYWTTETTGKEGLFVCFLAQFESILVGNSQHQEDKQAAFHTKKEVERDECWYSLYRSHGMESINIIKIVKRCIPVTVS